MKLNPSPAPVQLSIIITPSATDAEKLIVGQRLTATVTKVLEQGMATLAVRNMVFIARTALPLKAGQVLNLVVAENKPDLVMRVIKGEVETPVFPRALRYAVTNQRTHAELLANLKYIAGKPLDVAAHLPSAVVRFVRQAVLNLPDMRQLSSSEGMKTALFNAGVFLERKLLQQLAGNKEDMSLRQDFKAALLRLRG
ncbi:MAG: hypothetical protein OES09_16350, partial [Gammaproteobacteria bacterium]|nr:hypothetical protein [Gammaproteobacteria bacterium]